MGAYHYIRIFNSWVDAYHYGAIGADGAVADPTLTGIPFNDAYRYMDWLLTVPLLLIEILLVMKLDEATYKKGLDSGVRICADDRVWLLRRTDSLWISHS